MARWPVYADSELAGLCRLCRGRYMPTLPAVAGRLRCPEYADSQVAGICRPLTDGARIIGHMATCTAPVHGHRTASGRAACPACGGGYGRYGGYGSYSYPSYSP